MKAFNVWLAILALGVGAAAPAVGAGRPEADLRCESFGAGPKLDCTVLLRSAEGKPMTGADVRLGAMMPSMPMAHSVAPVVAESKGQPGEYRGVLTLEMNGVWAVQVDVSGPVRERIVRSLRIDECPGDQRCTAQPANATAAAEKRRH